MPNARVQAAGGAMSAPTAILEFTPTMRGLIENVIEDLILLLDEIDGEADLEDGVDQEREEGEFYEPWEGFRAGAGVGR